MNYTEEEYYGNKQKTVLESGEVQDIATIKENKQQEVNLPLTILTTCIKTLVSLFGILFYIIVVMVVLIPTSAIKVFDFTNFNKASLYCYERIYEKKQTLASLYNLVQKSIENKDYKRTSKYIKEFQNNSDYSNFCIKVNAMVISSSEKEYIAFVGDLDGYLVSQNILALYNKKEQDKAWNEAKNDLFNSNIYSFGLATYVDCLVNDKALSNQEKKDVLAVLKTKEVTIGTQTGLLLDFVNSRLNSLKLSDSLTVEDKILRVYTSLKINNVLVKIYEASNDTLLKNSAQDEIVKLQNTYNELIK